MKTEKTTPLAKELVFRIKLLIAENDLRPGDRLDPEFALARTLGVARMTLRKALHFLEAEGIIARKRRIGTVVKDLPAAVYSSDWDLDLPAIAIPKKIRLRFDCSELLGHQLAFWNTAANLYKRRYPHVTVEIIDRRWNVQKAGDPPADALLMPDWMILRAARAGKIRPLAHPFDPDGFIADDGEINTYSVPVKVSVRFFLINRKLYDRVRPFPGLANPATDDFLDYLEGLGDALGRNFLLACSPFRLATMSARGLLDDPSVRRNFHTHLKPVLKRLLKIKSRWTLEMTTPPGRFTQGSVLFHMFNSEVAPPAYKNSEFPIELMPSPIGSGGVRRIYPLNAAVATDSKNPDQAEDFVRFLTSDPVQELLAEKYFSIPAKRAFFERHLEKCSDRVLGAKRIEAAMRRAKITGSGYENVFDFVHNVLTVPIRNIVSGLTGLDDGLREIRDGAAEFAAKTKRPSAKRRAP